MGQKARWALRMALAATLAAASGGCESGPERTGSPIAAKHRAKVVQPGAPAVSADGEVYSDPRRAVASTPNRPAATPASNPARPAPAIDLDETPAVTKPAPTAVSSTTSPTSSSTASPTASAAANNPTKPSTPNRAPAIDLDDSAVAKPAPATPSKPQPAERPIDRPATPADPVRPDAPVAAPASADLSSQSGVTEFAVNLIETLSRSEQPDVRANAVEAAGMVPRRLESVIVAGLNDRNEGVVSVAAMTIGRQRLVNLAPRTRALLSNASPYVETSAIMALARNGEVVDDVKMSRLGELLFTNPSPRVRAHVAFLIGEIGNDSALPMLKDAAGRKMPLAVPGEYNNMMLQFAEAMFKLGDTAQIETIRAALTPGRPDDLEATAAAAQILGELGDKKPIDQMVYLSAYRDPTSKQLYPAEVRMQIASSLGKLGLDRGGFIADEFLKNEDPALRAQAAAVYGDTGRPEHLPKLVELMQDPLEQVRITAAAAVLKIARRTGTLAK